MSDIQIAHTIRSHGAQVSHFTVLCGEEMLTDLKYPMKGNTVPFWAVPVIAILVPLVVILVYYFIRWDVYDFHQAILGRVLPLKNFVMLILTFCLLFSVLITGVITDAIKDAVGRPRPDFFWRCFPNGKGVFNNVTTNVVCTGKKSDIMEGHKSFPSGHTSWSFAGLGFLSWYLSGKIRAFDRRGHVSKLCIILLPLLVAALVGVSRVDDYWHHWQDVFAGGFLGL
ncbi:lipid phosphate phosphatase 2 [Actinidia rufa]|uniref:Lipid phosphate phosphatase 2 n=1 Tax=Actinidia rufa TaxID=165716 RepID=A0A7J0GZ77_9ERIC|nr:lipid phosphate phosphatase 2 [Actinidia rufa]